MPRQTYEWLTRLQRAFVLGLRTSDLKRRAEFVKLYQRHLARTLCTRLHFVFSVQNWEVLSDSFWIAQALDLLLAVATDDDVTAALSANADAGADAGAGADGADTAAKKRKPLVVVSATGAVVPSFDYKVRAAKLAAHAAEARLAFDERRAKSAAAAVTQAVRWPPASAFRQSGAVVASACVEMIDDADGNDDNNDGDDVKSSRGSKRKEATGNSGKASKRGKSSKKKSKSGSGASDAMDIDDDDDDSVAALSGAYLSAFTDAEATRLDKRSACRYCECSCLTFI
jgi:hypothetical protein